MAEDFNAFIIETKLLRQILESVFSKDTASPGTAPTTPSAGHCAVSSIIVNCLLGPSAGLGGSCQFVSTKVNSDGTSSGLPLISHWFNRIQFSYETPYGSEVDVDLTGDQFGRPAIQIGPAGSLYPNTVIRDEMSLNTETLDRAFILLERVKVLLDAKAEALGIYGDEENPDLGGDSPD